MLKFDNVDLDPKSVMNKIFNEYEIVTENGVKIIKSNEGSIELSKFINEVSYLLDVPMKINMNGFDSIDGFYEHTSYYMRHVNNKTQCIYNDIRIVKDNFDTLIVGDYESEVPYYIHYMNIYNEDIELSSIKPEIELAHNNYKEILSSHGK